MLDYLKQVHEKKIKSLDNFYTASGISVYVRQPITNGVNIESVMAKIEAQIPHFLLSEVEMVIVGWFDRDWETLIPLAV